MKTLLNKSLLFIAIPLIIFLAPYFYRKKITYNKINEISENYSVLVMGDSHMQTINPSLFKEKTFNFASSGEHYFYTYSKLRLIIANNPGKLRYIIIGVSPHNFAPIYKRLYDLTKIEGKTSLQRYLYFVNFFNVMGHNYIDFLRCNSLYRGIFSGTDWGGYHESQQSNLQMESIDVIIKIHYTDYKSIMSSFQEFYLSKIIKICNDNAIKLIAVSTPVHKEYYNRIPKKYIEKTNSISRENKNSFIYVNYLQSQMPDNYYSNGDHLNVFGSKIIALKIDSLIGKLEKAN